MASNWLEGDLTVERRISFSPPKYFLVPFSRASLVVAVKNPPANAGDTDSIPGWGRSFGEGNVNPLQYSHLENPMDREAWWATVDGVTKNWT